jgi:hypothetical protein
MNLVQLFRLSNEIKAGGGPCDSPPGRQGPCAEDGGTGGGSYKDGDKVTVGSGTLRTYGQYGGPSPGRPGFSIVHKGGNMMHVRTSDLLPGHQRPKLGIHQKTSSAPGVRIQKFLDKPSLEERKPPKDPRTLPGAAINKALDKIDDKISKMTQRMIDKGYGSIRHSDLPMTDPEVVEYKKLYDERATYKNEIDHRYGPGAPSRLPKGFGPVKQNFW